MAGTTSFHPTATFTPAAAAYSANDIIEGAKTFSAFGPVQGGIVRVVSSNLLVAHTAVISGETSYRLYLYGITPPSAPADNAAFDLPAGDRASFLAYIDLGTPVDLGSTLWVQISQDVDIVVPAGGTVYGLLVTNGAFTATAAARTVRLNTATF